MKRVTLLCLGLVIGLTGCKFIHATHGIQGSGTVKSEKRSISAFTSIEVSCQGSIVVRSQAPLGLEISGDDNIVPLITTEVKNDTLYIRSDKEYESKSKLQIIVSTADLKRFIFSGAGEAQLSNISNEQIELVLSGAGSINASGETKDAEVKLTGAGSIEAKDLHSANAKVNLTGTGSVDIYASGQLDAQTTGVGEINYYGHPKVVNKKAGGLGEISER